MMSSLFEKEQWDLIIAVRMMYEFKLKLILLNRFQLTSMYYKIINPNRKNVLSNIAHEY